MTTERPDERRVLGIRDQESARALARTWLTDPDGRAKLRDLLADELAPANLSEWEDDEVLDALAHRIARADLTPLARPRVYRSADQIKIPERAAAEPVLAAPKETTWVAIQLVDEEGDPVPGERYELKLPDGSVQRGDLNFRGRARVDDIEEPGACEISFPDLDKDVWERI